MKNKIFFLLLLFLIPTFVFAEEENKINNNKVVDSLIIEGDIPYISGKIGLGKVKNDFYFVCQELYKINSLGEMIIIAGTGYGGIDYTTIEIADKYAILAGLEADGEYTNADKEKVTFTEDELILNDDGTFSVSKNSFTMPSSDVEISAEFEAIVIENPNTLDSIGLSFMLAITSIISMTGFIIYGRKLKQS